MMSLELAKAYLSKYGKDKDIMLLKESSATVELAAKALGTQPERIAKSLSFLGKDNALIVVCAGDCKIDNHAYKERFRCKAKMLKPEEVEKYTNHTIGGVSPFGVPNETKVYLDESLKRFDFVYPACGTANSAIKLTNGELEEILPNAEWVDVCKGWRE